MWNGDAEEPSARYHNYILLGIPGNTGIYIVYRHSAKIPGYDFLSISPNPVDVPYNPTVHVDNVPSIR